MQRIFYITSNTSAPRKPKTWSFRGSISFSTDDFWEIISRKAVVRKINEHKVSNLTVFFLFWENVSSN